MLQIGAFLLSALIASTSAAPPKINTDAIPVLLNIAGCMNLNCEFQGYTEDWKSQRKPFEMPIDYLRENETEVELFARLERKYPLNTFTFMNHADGATMFKQYSLVCNSFFTISYTQLIDFLKDPEALLKPKLVCGDKDQLAFAEMIDNLQ